MESFQRVFYSRGIVLEVNAKELNASSLTHCIVLHLIVRIGTLNLCRVLLTTSKLIFFENYFLVSAGHGCGPRNEQEQSSATLPRHCNSCRVRLGFQFSMDGVSSQITFSQHFGENLIFHISVDFNVECYNVEAEISIQAKVTYRHLKFH